MWFSNNLLINLYSIIILVIIYVHSLTQSEKLPFRYKLYALMLQFTAIMLVVDILSRFDGNPGTIYSKINHIGNFLIFLLNPVAPSIWLLYAHFEIFRDETLTKRFIKPAIMFIVLYAIMVIFSLPGKWLYYIDDNNIYHRGPLYFVPVVIVVGLTIAAFVLITVNRKIIEKKHYFSLIFFPVPPLAGILLQLVFYGTSLILNGMTISLLIVFFTIQNHTMDTDFLTGVYNRKRLETYMKHKIKSCSEHHTFSAILIDLNNFKSINDNYGHDMGDRALEISASMLKSCLRSNDFIARYGGDEFYIILDVSTQDDLDQAVDRINGCLEKYNSDPLKPYPLSFSMGYAVYDIKTQMRADEFQRKIDKLMYENKRAYKERLSL